MLPRNLLAGVAAFLLVAAGAVCAQAQDAAPPDAAPPADTAPTNTVPTGDAQTPAPAPPVPALLLDPNGPRVLIQTSMGDITLQLDPVDAPRTVANFLRYVRERHFDGTVFYRVNAGFVIQMGSWDAKGHGRLVHAPIPLEAGLSNLRGTVAMAHGDDPDSATAEFFINLIDDTPLDQSATDKRTGFAVFGQVISGMDVVDAISKVPVGDNGPMPGAAPVDPVLVKKVSVLKN